MKPQLSIIIPVLREANLIGDAIESLSSIGRDTAFELVVVDGGLHGETIQAIPHDHVIKLSSSPGRGNQLNAGARDASGKILLFLHVDTRLPDGAPAQIVESLSRPGVVAGSFTLGIGSNKPAYRIIEGAVSLRTRLTRIPYGDQGIFIDARIFHTLGGFKAIPIMEDVDLMRRVKKSGGRIAVVSSQVLTSPRRWEAEGVVRCTLRNWFLMTCYLMGASPERLSRFYRPGRPHRQLR